MANLPESATFDAGIYQIELADPVLGGVNGISNAQAKGLANRTTWLKEQVDALNALKGKGIQAFSAASSYAGGDQVIYQKNIWQANTSITPGAFNAANWTRQLGKLAAIDDTITEQLILQRSATLNDLNTAVLQIQAANDAIMWFHRPGLYSVGFGLNANNKLVFGGAGSSLGTVNEIYHEANCPKSLAGSGWQKLASGLILQWGISANTGGGRKVQGLPITFPNVFLSIVATGPADSSGQTYLCSATIISTSQFAYGVNIQASSTGVVTATGSNTPPVNWLAIGY